MTNQLEIKLLGNNEDINIIAIKRYFFRRIPPIVIQIILVLTIFLSLFENYLILTAGYLTLGYGFLNTIFNIFTFPTEIECEILFKEDIKDYVFWLKLIGNDISNNYDIDTVVKKINQVIDEIDLVMRKINIFNAETYINFDNNNDIDKVMDKINKGMEEINNFDVEKNIEIGNKYDKYKVANKIDKVMNEINKVMDKIYIVKSKDNIDNKIKDDVDKSAEKLRKYVCELKKNMVEIKSKIKQQIFEDKKNQINYYTIIIYDDRLETSNFYATYYIKLLLYFIYLSGITYKVYDYNNFAQKNMYDYYKNKIYYVNA